MVKYASKGESRSKEAQRMLTRLVAAAADDQSDMRPTMREMMRKVMIKCPTRRDMCVQEVMHLLLQVPSVDHDLEFVRARSETTSVELVDAGANGGLVGRQYARRMQDDASALTASARPPVEECRSMPFSQFAPDFRLNNGGRLVSYTRRNRVILFSPTFSSNPRSSTYPDCYRNSLVRFRP